MCNHSDWCDDLLDTADALEEEALLLTLLCDASLASSLHASDDIRTRCFQRLRDYLEQHTFDLRTLVRAAVET